MSSLYNKRAYGSFLILLNAEFYSNMYNLYYEGKYHNEFSVLTSQLGFGYI